MNLKHIAFCLTPVFFLTTSGVLRAELPQPIAFPGAEGFGAGATGGRGGGIVHVKNLNDSGKDSFRDAVSQPDRIVVFDVGGVIPLKSAVAVSSNITIAGQTAPGDGITLYGTGISCSQQNNIIIRYLRLRGSIENSRGSKSLNVSTGGRMIFDHLSMSWGRWDNLGFTVNSHDITLQDSISTEAIDPQRFGAIIDTALHVTVARTLWSNNQSRNPKGKSDMQFINNVIYNYGKIGYAGGHSKGGLFHQDLINNCVIAGPSSDGKPFSGFDYDPATNKGDSIYLSGNTQDVDHDGLLKLTPVDEAQFDGKVNFVKDVQNHCPYTGKILTAEDGLCHVLVDAGASLHRDIHDRRVVDQLLSFGKSGKIINAEKEVGGIGTLNGGTPPTDSDGDGIPDDWETSHGLDPKNPTDAAAIDPKTGYANIELYVNSLAANPASVQAAMTQIKAKIMQAVSDAR